MDRKLLEHVIAGVSVALTSLLLGCHSVAPDTKVPTNERATATVARNPALEAKFANPDQTIEYHFMIDAPALTEANRDQVLARLTQALKPFVDIGAIQGPKDGAYIDSRGRVLDKSNLILRLRGGNITVKARSTNVNAIIDLQPCDSIKYEQDYFDAVGYSISSDLKFKSADWLTDPTKATVAQTFAFMQSKCPALAAQLESALKPLGSLSAPGTAKMYSADAKLVHPLAVDLKETGFSAWLFPGTTQSLVEVAWTGYVKNKASMDVLYADMRKQLRAAGLLARDQNSKTEQYFAAFYGPKASVTQ
jgi:hypothetical protein